MQTEPSKTQPYKIAMQPETDLVESSMHKKRGFSLSCRVKIVLGEISHVFKYIFCF